MIQWEHSAILPTFIKLPFVIKMFVSSIINCDRFTQSLLYFGGHLVTMASVTRGPEGPEALT